MRHDFLDLNQILIEEYGLLLQELALALLRDQPIVLAVLGLLVVLVLLVELLLFGLDFDLSLLDNVLAEEFE